MLPHWRQDSIIISLSDSHAAKYRFSACSMVTLCNHEEPWAGHNREVATGAAGPAVVLAACPGRRTVPQANRCRPRHDPQHMEAIHAGRCRWKR